MIGCLVLLPFADASSCDAVQLFAVDADPAVLILLDVDAVIYLVCLLCVADVEICCGCCSFPA